MPPEEPISEPVAPIPPSEPLPPPAPEIAPPAPEPAIVSSVEPPSAESQTPEVQQPTPEPAPLPEPAPVPAPTPEPQPEPAAPPAPELVPPSEPKPEPPIAPITTPPVVVAAPPTPLPRSSSVELTNGEPVPAKHNPKYTKGVPKRVLELTTEEIDAARKLWAQEHIAVAQAQGNRNRKARMERRMDEIEKLIKTEHLSTTHAIAGSMRLSEKTTSGYLQKLVHANRINANGNSSNRRYSG